MRQKPAGQSVVRLHVQPRASKTEVVGRHGDAIKLKVKAPPLDGAANDELVRFLAKRLHVPRSAVELVSGARSRHKRVAVRGWTAGEIEAALR